MMVQKRSGDLIQTQKYYRSQVERLKYSCFDTEIRENKSLHGIAPEEQVPVVLNGSSQETYKNVRNELEEITVELIERLEL